MDTYNTPGGKLPPLPASVRVVIPDGEALLVDVAEMADRAEMVVIHNGSRVIVASAIPAGWRRLGINQRRAIGTQAGKDALAAENPPPHKAGARP